MAHGKSWLRSTLHSKGFSSVELRCGLFGADLELLDGDSQKWAKGFPLELDLDLDELPSSAAHVVLATVGRTGSEGGSLSLSVTGCFKEQYRRSQVPEHGRAQGSMLAVLSRSQLSGRFALQEVVPNIGLSCEQQEDATVRELYWPEVGVAIERTVATEQGPLVTWLEVFRAYPEGQSDEDTETASHASLPGSSRPELVTSLMSPSSEMDKGSLGSIGRSSWTGRYAAHPSQSQAGAPDVRDFGPPRPMSDRLEVSELCQEAGRLSVSLKLSMDRLSKSEALVSSLRSQLAEEKKLKAEQTSKIHRLRSDLEHCTAELSERNGVMCAQHGELEEMARSRAKEISLQDRLRGQVTGLQQELARLNQQLMREREERSAERSLWEQERAQLQGRGEDGVLQELAKVQADFAEELSSARGRLAMAEQRNKELLESLRSTVATVPEPESLWASSPRRLAPPQESVQSVDSEGPDGSLGLPETLRRAAARRRAKGKATRALDDEYTRFKEGCQRRLEQPQISSQDMRETRESRKREAHAAHPFVLSDLGL